MKISTSLVSLAAATLANAYADNCYKCHEDRCLQAVIGYGHPYRNGKKDCNSYLEKTVTPKPRTVYITKYTTVTPTTYLSVTTTQAIPATATTTVSEVETDVVPYTQTVTEEDTATVYVTDATVTETYTNSPLNPKRAISTARNTPSYASVCRRTQAYLTACHCVGATPHTKTAPCPVTTKTITSTRTAKAATVTSVATLPLTTTVATQTILTTYTTEIVTSTVETDIVTTTDATTTIYETATVTETVTPLQTFAAIINYAPAQQPNSNIYPYLRPLNSAAYFIDTTSDASMNQIFSLNPADGTVAVIGGPADGDLAFYSRNVGPSSFILVTTAAFAASQGGVQVKCSISTGTLACDWKDQPLAAEVWICGGHLNLVQPGYDFTNTCNAGGTAFKVTVSTIPQ